MFLHITSVALKQAPEAGGCATGESQEIKPKANWADKADWVERDRDQPFKKVLENEIFKRLLKAESMNH